MTPEYREAPNNIEAEQALLGAVLVNNDAYYAVADLLQASQFHEPLHRRIFETAAELIKMGKSANPVTIKTFLPANEKLGDMTVAQYLARLAAEAVNVINAPDYAKAIVALAKRRALIAIGERLVNIAYDAPVESSPEEIGEASMAEIADVVDSSSEFHGAVSFEAAVTSAIDATNQAYMADGERAGVEYQMAPLRRLIGPLTAGQLVILGGATKQGKTALAGQVAIGAAREGWPVWMYSGELSPEEIAMREMGRDTKIPVWKQKRGEVSEAQFGQMVDFGKQTRSLPIVIQKRRLTLAGIKERARAFVRKKGKSVIVIDHIGLIDRDRGQQKLSSWEFGEEVTRELKSMGRELECPVVACAQLKKNTFAENKGPITERGLDQIINRKPRYTDLIGAVERDADHVIIPFRPDVFLMEHEPTPGTELYGVWECKVNEWRGRAKIVLALSREMRWPDSVDVGWDGATTTFFEIGEEYSDRYAGEFSGNPMRLF